MADVFDEISDDLRREKLQQFWKENGAWIIGGAVAAVLLTGILAFWREWEFRRDAAATAQLVQLAAAGDVAKLSGFARETDKKHAMIAKFLAAGDHLKRKETAEAAALYGEIAGTSGVDRNWRDLAKLLSISQRLDKDDPAVLKKELAELSGDKGVWRFTAREMQALLEARQGNPAAAVDVLAKIIADPAAPADARARAFGLREFYAAQKPDTKS